MHTLLACSLGALIALAYVALLGVIKALPIVPSSLAVVSVVGAEALECLLSVIVVIGAVYLPSRLLQIRSWRPALLGSITAFAVHAVICLEPWIGLPVWPLGAPQVASGVLLAAALGHSLRPRGL
jgi:hypothetical protein